MCKLLNSRSIKTILLIAISLSVVSCSTTSFKPEALIPLIESKYFYIMWSDKFPVERYRKKLYSDTESAFVNAGFEVTDEHESADLVVVLSGRYRKLDSDWDHSVGINQKVSVSTAIEVFIIATYTKPGSGVGYSIFGKTKAASDATSTMIIGNRKGNVVTKEMRLQATRGALFNYQKQLHDVMDKVKK